MKDLYVSDLILIKNKRQSLFNGFVIIIPLLFCKDGEGMEKKKEEKKTPFILKRHDQCDCWC